MTQSKPEMPKLLMGLLGERHILSSLKLCGCEARVSVAILLQSDENLTENGVNPQRLEKDVKFDKGTRHAEPALSTRKL